MREMRVAEQRYKAVLAVIGDGRTVTEVARDWLVIRGGFNVFRRVVEDALLEPPDVASAGVVGRPDKRLGQEVVAFVSLTTDSTVVVGEAGRVPKVGWARASTRERYTHLGPGGFDARW
jgi:acyl-CoA synthetase (AMP-forming)/AMP-acid ligase II